MDLTVLDPDAVRAVRRLQSRDFEAYLVGGCVRDLLLGQSPKDYDIATEARPQQVKRVFPRNCRIIGRRFKLAHLHFHQNQKILEAATFRRTPEEGSDGEDEDDLLITRDNEFGTAEEDALRRDFTVNALFLDPSEDCILDYTSGLDDVEDRIIRTIGDPEVRFREDPVRILRAAKFAGRLGFRIDRKTLLAMAHVADDLTRAAPPRLLEEILRLLRGGHAVESFQLLRDIGALQVMLPVVADYLKSAQAPERNSFWRCLEALDDLCASGAEVSSAVLLGTLFCDPIEALAAARQKRSPTTIAEETLGPFCLDLRLPRRDSGSLKRICAVQHRFRSDGATRRFRVNGFVRDPYFPEALQLFELRAQASGEDLGDVYAWRDRMVSELGCPTDVDAERALFTDGTGGPEALVHPRQVSGGGPRRQRADSDGSGGHGSGRAAKAKGGKPDKKQRKKDKHHERKDRKGRNRQRVSSDVQTAPHHSRKVDTIEPVAVDLSAFDVELDPRRVPTFGSIVEGDTKKKKKRRGGRHGIVDGDLDDYRPPPPSSDGGDAPPPPPPASDTFGDW